MSTKFEYKVSNGGAPTGLKVIANDGTLTSRGIKTVTETFTLSDFTDGGGASGTVDFTDSLPVGAVVLRTLIEDVTGFAGDTSATVTIGDGTDVDRYSTGTPSVFTTIASVDAGAPSGTVFHAAAKTPKVTVTSATDFTSVTAGSITVSIIYYKL